VIVGFEPYNDPRPTSRNRVLECAERADVGEHVAEAALAELIDVELERSAEEGDADDLPSGADGVERLSQRPLAGSP